MQDTTSKGAPQTLTAQTASLLVDDAEVLPKLTLEHQTEGKPFAPGLPPSVDGGYAARSCSAEHLIRLHAEAPHLLFCKPDSVIYYDAHSGRFHAYLAWAAEADLRSADPKGNPSGLVRLGLVMDLCVALEAVGVRP